jgi:hypothetical protein
MNFIQPENKRKRGDLREDGYVFSNYTTRKGKKVEVWRSPGSFARMIEGIKAYRIKNPDKVRAGIKRWREKNLDKDRAYQKKWRDQNLQYNRDRNKKWRETNLEYNQSRVRQWDTTNRERRKCLNKVWRKSNPERERTRKRQHRILNRPQYQARDAERRVLIREQLKSLSKEQRAIIIVIYQLSERVSKCLGIKHHVDHIIPLKPAKGSSLDPGRHTPTNLRVIPARLNLSKNNRQMSLPHLNG